MERLLPVLVSTALAVFTFTAVASAQVPVNATTPSVATPVVNLDQPGRIPYQTTISRQSLNGLDNVSVVFKAIPAGHRLVIQQVSAAISTTTNLPADTKLRVFVTTLANIDSFAFSPAPFIGVGHLGEFGQALQFYVDAGEQPEVFVITAVSGFDRVDVTLIGYELDCTVAACAPIAGGSAR